MVEQCPRVCNGVEVTGDTVTIQAQQGEKGCRTVTGERWVEGNCDL